MKKIRVKELIEFKRRSERSRITFINFLKNRVIDTNSSSGGDYWKSCLSAIHNVFKNDDIKILDKKIDLLNEKIMENDDERIRNQFQRNIDVLYNFKDFDFYELKPNAELTFLKKPSDLSILEIKGLPIQTKPDHVFTYSINNIEKIGAVWFIAQLDGFKKEELGMFVDVLHRYLIEHFSQKFFVSTSYCIAVDVNRAQYVRYKDIEEGKIPKIFEQTIDDIRKLL